MNEVIASIPWSHAHPVLVNFTAGLVPISAICDLLFRITKKESFGPAAWWTLLFATLLTPATALTGWLWKSSLPSAALPGHLIVPHQWLGTLLIFVFGALLWRRFCYFRQSRVPRIGYLLLACITVGLLIIQGNLGGRLVFG